MTASSLLRPTRAIAFAVVAGALGCESDSDPTSTTSDATLAADIASETSDGTAMPGDDAFEVAADDASTPDVEVATAACPTPNESFSGGCEPVLSACVSEDASVFAESFRGTFGSIGPGGQCQSEWPDPWLATCTEPIADGLPDMRGLWADDGHVERIEQCGNLVIIVGDNYTHGGFATGVPEDGVNDVRADGSCEQPIQVALRFEGTALQFVQDGLVVVTRTLESAPDGSDELVWRFGPGLAELARMRRYCSLKDVPPTASSGLPGGG
jgi:hypothetical protein